MKRLAITVLTLFTCGAAYALPVGNPSEASLFLQGAWWDSSCCNPCDPCFSWCDAWNLRIGYYGDFVFNRHLQTDSNANGQHDIDRTEIFTNAGYLALNICDRLDIFGTIGATSLHIITDARSWRATSSLESELFFHTDFSWSIGARATLWECDCFAIGLEGQYFQTNPDLDTFLQYKDGDLRRFNNNNEVTYSEWQVGLGASYRIGTRCPSIAMVPYVAVKWAGSHLNFDNFSFTETIGGVPVALTMPNLKNNKLWGYAVGMTLTLCDVIGVTVEGRWADEKALYANGQLRF